MASTSSAPPPPAEEYKKRRGPVSCAECRRLKLKCDRKLPCASCTKRGCAAICPNGTLAAGPGNRFVLADTQQLHEKIEHMSKRILELEDALSALQAQISNERHPLLSEELMLLKAPPVTQTVEKAVVKGMKPLCESLGTLTLDGENTQFFGPNAASDYQLLPEEMSDTPCTSTALPLDLLLLADAFPMTNVQELKDDVYHRIADWLPSATDAWTLVDAYYTNAAWVFNPMPRDELVETVVRKVYKTDRASVEDVKPHDLAVMCMIFAEAYLTAMDRPPYSPEAVSYYQLARVCLGLDSVIEHPTLQSLRTIHMMTTFCQMLDQANSATTCYMLLGLGAQVCMSLGLHRDDTEWNLSEYERERRRHVFWETVAYDMWAALAFGRPPGFTGAQVDAKMPEIDLERFVGEDGTIQMSFRMWNHIFAKECLLKVMDQAFGVGSLTYGTVLRLDRMVREHPIAASLKLVNVGQVDSSLDQSLILQRNVIFALTQKLLLYLHRSFFAQALIEHPNDPLKSKYAQSVLAAFRCAFYITASARALYASVPLSLRFWLFWSQCFSASIILGSIVIKCPGSGLAPAAWVEFERVYEFFERVAPDSRRITRMLPKLRAVRAKAHDAYTAFTNASDGQPRRVISPEEELELRFLWGQTRLVDKGVTTTSARHDHQHSSTPSSSSTGASSSTQPSTTPDPASSVDLFSPFGVPPPTWTGMPQPLPQDSIFGVTHPHAQWYPQYHLPHDTHTQALPTAPIDTTAPPVQVPSTSTYGGMPSMSMLAQAAAMAPPIWSADEARAPLPSPSPGASAEILDGQTLDATWQRFMDGIGLPFDDGQDRVAAFDGAQP